MEHDNDIIANGAIARAHHKLLFADPNLTAFAILDGASIPDLLERLTKENPEHVCLTAGKLVPELARAAAYLVRLESDDSFTEWILADGWLRHWGIFALSRRDIRIVRNHLRDLLMVDDPDGKRLYFRYYDPRVLRLYLPTCTDDEKKIVFGPITKFLCEDKREGEMLSFTL
ncbi:MAG: DUF4123 domain-containing protein [Bacteroidota bacterium]